MKSKSAEYRKNYYFLLSLFVNLIVELNNVRFRNFQIVRGLIVRLKFWCTLKINFNAFITRIIISSIFYFLYMTRYKSHLTYFNIFWFLKYSQINMNVIWLLLPRKISRAPKFKILTCRSWEMNFPKFLRMF